MKTRPFTWDDLIVMEVGSGIYTRYFPLQIGDVVVDAGAHIGSFTVLAAQAVGPQGHVYAFEPHPENYQLLAENVAGLQNVTARPHALGSVTGVSTVRRLLEPNTGIVRLGEGDLAVEVHRLDDVVPRIDFLKLDAEGSEFEILKGAEILLRLYPARIAAELEDRATADAAAAFLAGLGYTTQIDPYWFNSILYAWVQKP